MISIGCNQIMLNNVWIKKCVFSTNWYCHAQLYGVSSYSFKAWREHPNLGTNILNPVSIKHNFTLIKFNFQCIFHMHKKRFNRLSLKVKQTNTGQQIHDSMPMCLRQMAAWTQRYQSHWGSEGTVNSMIPFSTEPTNSHSQYHMAHVIQNK